MDIDESLIELEKGSNIIRIDMNIVEFPIFTKTRKPKKKNIKEEKSQKIQADIIIEPIDDLPPYEDFLALPECEQNSIKGLAYENYLKESNLTDSPTTKRVYVAKPYIRKVLKSYITAFEEPIKNIEEPKNEKDLIASIEKEYDNLIMFCADIYAEMFKLGFGNSEMKPIIGIMPMLNIYEGTINDYYLNFNSNTRIGNLIIKENI